MCEHADADWLAGRVVAVGAHGDRASGASGGASGTAVGKRKCHPSYKGACLKVGIGDYDCGGGRGNGPNYVWKTVRVVGPDVFRLDADRDGFGCE